MLVNVVIEFSLR